MTVALAVACTALYVENDRKTLKGVRLWYTASSESFRIGGNGEAPLSKRYTVEGLSFGETSVEVNVTVKNRNEDPVSATIVCKARPAETIRFELVPPGGEMKERRFMSGFYAGRIGEVVRPKIDGCALTSVSRVP